MKVVINKRYGGFSISFEALILLIQLESKGVVKYEVQEYCGIDKANPEAYKLHQYTRFMEGLTDCREGYKQDSLTGVLYKDGFVYAFSRDYEFRTDPVLIDVVSKLEARANTKYSDLRIIEIPDGVEWDIEDYDGMESIHEKHRVWE